MCGVASWYSEKSSLIRQIAITNRQGENSAAKRNWHPVDKAVTGCPNSSSTTSERRFERLLDSVCAMAIKSPFSMRSPTVLPIVRNLDSNSVVVIDSDKLPRSVPIRPKRERATSYSKFLQKVPLDLVVAIFIWYLVGVGSICTSKILLSGSYSVPPLVLTFQQLALGSSLIRLHLWITRGSQSLPKQRETQRNGRQLSLYYDLILMGFFNALDFVATNTSFSLSSASFVETIKASEPITTTAIALFYGIEILRLPEAFSILILVAGVFCSTMGNASQEDDGSAFQSLEEAELRWHLSIKTCVVILTANICFALRIKSQKLLRAQPSWKHVDDANLLMWMQQAGAIVLLVPVLASEMSGIVQRTRETPWETQRSYFLLSIANASAFSMYSLAAFHALSKLSVAQFTGFGCLRRLFAIVFTSVAFGVPITPIGAFGIALSLSGFCAFSYYRFHNPPSYSNGHAVSAPSPAPKGTLTN